MLSKTAQYALRAFAYIAAQEVVRPILAKDIARRTSVPLHYLSRILRDGVRAGLLESARGVGGGFRLSRPPARIKLIEVLSLFDDVPGRSRCPFGQPRCNDQHPCGFHEHWKPVSAAYRRMLEQTTFEGIDLKGLGGAARKAAK